MRRTTGLAQSLAAMLLLGGLCISTASLAQEPLDIRIELTYAYDDNVARARDADRLSDGFFGLNVSKSKHFPVTEHTRFVLQGIVAAEKFQTYSGLSRYSLGIEGEFEYRPSAEFGAPTFALFGRAHADRYESDLRDGYHYSAGISVRKSITDRIDLSGALAYNVREGKSTVFDTKDYSVRVNADYSLTRAGTIYLGAEYRRGDIVSSEGPVLIVFDIAEAIVRDDAFPDRFAYRLNARTFLTTLGYNWSFAAGHALDFSWRWVESTATSKPSFVTAEKVRYRSNQFSVAYLFRF